MPRYYPIELTLSTRINNTELLSTNLRGVTVTSVYKSPTICFNPSNIAHNDTWVVIGDFNGHSINWGYDVTDGDGDLVESWADSNHLSLIHDPKLPHSCNSGRWKRGYNPYIGFISHNIASLTSKCILDPIPHAQHCSIAFQINADITTNCTFTPSLQLPKSQLEEIYS